MNLLKASIASLLALIITICVSSVYADLLVQLNVNRPLNDVNEKFVSFTVDPADLYQALDGANRKTLTQMATMLGTSYIKFSNDYNFIPDTDMKYRNPTKTIWKGFNRWTSAVNWTMIVPLPYQAGEWDPMESLRILNSSYSMGINDCIWQLGTELGSSVSEYFNDLNTLNLMVDTFIPYVDDWEVIGAEISSGSTNEEIRRYIEYSKDMNAAFNWLQSEDATTSNTMVGSAYENDRVLRAMFNQKSPVWLNFMPKDRMNKSKRGSSGKTREDVHDVLRWAQTLGEAASSGFDAIFRRMDLDDLEHPSQNFFVTLVFKKVMGSRVFPARPFTIFLRSNKLYTHCANTVSGGIAFMIVNPDDESKQVSIRSAIKLSGDEYWQYILTFKKNHVYLNNEKLTLNSTLPPQVKTKSPNKSIQLNSPAKSVGFWVLPNAELEHCQFTEIDVDDLERDSEEEKVLHKHISSSDKLLQQLIQETALPEDAVMKNNHRGRRYATFANRVRHVVLKDKDEHIDSLAKLFEPLSLEEKTPKKREEALEDRRSAALKWIKDLLHTAMQDGEDMISLKRNTRSVDDYFGAFFGTQGAHKRLPVVKKITEIRKPEKKSIKPAYDPENFNEEDFFKKMGTQNEPEFPRVPEGDVHLTHITNVEGEDAVASKERGKKKLATMNIHGTIGKETRNEMKPLRLLPTEFYEALPVSNVDQMHLKKPHKWNALLFPEPFTKKSIIIEKKLKSNILGDSTALHDIDPDVEKVDIPQFQTSGQLAEDFLRAQEELARTFMREHEEKEDEQKSNKKVQSETHTESENEMLEKIKSLRSKYIDYLAENLENYFNEHGAVGALDVPNNLERTTATVTTEAPWWNLSSLRKRRAARDLRYQQPDDVWLTNMITKDEELLPLGSVMPERLLDNERVRISNHLQMDDKMTYKKYNGYLRTVKARVDKVVDIVAKHVNDWYNTFTKPVEELPNEAHANILKITRVKSRI